MLSVFRALVLLNVADLCLAYRRGGNWEAFYAVADPLG